MKDILWSHEVHINYILLYIHTYIHTSYIHTYTSVARFIDQKIHAYKNKNNTGILSITLLEGQDVFAYANSEPGVTFLVAVITSVVGS